jgi:hypothetical protein
MVGGREMWWVLASGGQLDGVVNSMGDYVNSQKQSSADKRLNLYRIFTNINTVHKIRIQVLRHHVRFMLVLCPTEQSLLRNPLQNAA